MRRTTIKILLSLLIFASQSYLQTLFAQTVEKSIIINGENVELKNCQEVYQIKSISLPVQNVDSISIKMILIAGAMPKGCMLFKSVEEFNTFNIKTWLILEKKSDDPSVTFKSNDCAAGAKSPAIGGDRLLISISSGSTELKYYILPFCN